MIKPTLIINREIKYLLPREKYRHNHELKALEFQFYENYISMKKIIDIWYKYDVQTFARNLFV